MFRRLYSSKAKVFVWGSGNSGQLGQKEILKTGIRNTYEHLLPVELTSLPKHVTQLSFGTTHSMAVTKKGEVYAFGDSEYGKLGLEHAEKIVKEPRLVEALKFENIVQMNCGDHHTAAVTKDGRVLTFGWGGSFSAGACGLGHGDYESNAKPTVVETLFRDGAPIGKVECGDMHTMALTKDHELWIWGNGEHGRMGSGSANNCLVPVPMEYFEEDNIVDIAAGQQFSVALREDGSVFTWGRNSDFQLGLGGGLTMDVSSIETFPTHVEALEGVHIKKVAAGHSLAAAICKDGKLYVWGMRQWLAPHLVAELDGHNIVQVACGEHFVAAISDKGKLFTLGKGGSTCLGHGDRTTRHQATLVEALSNYHVSHVACGAHHIGVIATSTLAADNDFSLRH